MNDLPFPDLVGRAKDGDGPAQEALYQLALGMALKSARKRMAKHDRALLESQDVRQSVLLRLHSRLPDLEFGSERDLAAWLAEATKRLMMEKRRNARREKRDVNRNVPFPTAGIPDGSVASVRKALTRLAIEDSLDDLPPETADVVRLHALGGLSFAEVADRLELPGADAARKRYARALVKLGGLLGELDRP